MRGRIVAQSLLAIAAAGCGGAVDREYTSAEGRFRARFPGTPKLRPPRRDDRSPMGFYSIPDPATETIVADPSSTDSNGVDRPGDSFGHDPGTVSHGVASAGGTGGRPAGPMRNEPVPRGASSTRPATTAKLSEPAVSTRPRVQGRESTEVPAILRPSAGGATIVSFNWLDRKEDRVGTSGRKLEPDGGIRPDHVFGAEVVLAIRGTRHHLSARCQRKGS